jgi:hypothetical protein
VGTYNRTTITYPHLTCILVNPKTVEQYQIALIQADEEKVIEEHFDTSFNFSNKYVSTLSYCHPLLENSEASEENCCKKPIIPLITVIHEKKI